MTKHLAIALFAAACLAPIAAALELQDEVRAEQIIKEQLPSYPAGPCLVSGEELGGELGEPVDLVHEGRLVRLCQERCESTFAENPAKYLAELDRRVIAEQLPSYPLDSCVVGGGKLGSMGEPIDYVAGTRLVRFCCKGCISGFQKDPGKAMAKINAALIEAQKKTYPLKTCLVSGEELGSMGEPIDYLYGTRLVRLCCKSCVREFEKKPRQLLAKLAK